MTRLALVALVIALSGCPQKPSPAGPTPQVGAGCPAASDVYLASYVTQDPSSGRSGWVVPLHAVAADPATQGPDYAAVDAATAGAAGVPPIPTGTAWLATAGGEPCRARLVGYYAARIDGPPANVSYGLELEGCPAPPNPEEAGGFVLVSEQAPTGCLFEVPQPIAARLGQLDANKQWQPPREETPIPPQLAAVIPEGCEPPGCEKLWAFGEIRVGNQPVAWGGAVNWLQIGSPAEPCTWEGQRFSGVFVPGPDGRPIRITEGQERPLVLLAALADRGGAKVLLAEGPGVLATYDLVPGGARLGRRMEWMQAPPEAWQATDDLTPPCEPPPAP
jgi:hypothetical protein